ncbi:MAG: hypothetical protein ACK5HS_00760, partial [Mycoplasmatales bacterium]
IAIGCGEYYIGILTYLAVMFCLSVLNKINYISINKYKYNSLMVTYNYTRDTRNNLGKFLEDHNVSLKDEIMVNQNKKDNKIITKTRIDIKYSNREIDIEELIRDLIELDYVTKVNYINETEKLS